ncbi:hypothetical protein D3C86_2229900 [compost metagenome]
MDNLAHLLACCRYDVGVAVTCARNTDAGGEIEVLFAVGRVDPAAESVVNDDRSGLLEEGAESCHGLILS